MRVLDTDTCVELLRGNLTVIARRAAIADEVTTTWMTAAELYFGAARVSEVRSVALDGRGDFAGKPRLEYSMVGLGVEGDEKARRIIFSNNTMLIRAMEFEFNLIATSERQQTEYQLRYDTSVDAWKPLQNHAP